MNPQYLAPCIRATAEMTFTLTSTSRSIELQVFTKTPATIKRDGLTLTMFASPAQFSAGSEGWIAGPQAGFISIKFQHAGSKTTVQF